VKPSEVAVAVPKMGLRAVPVKAMPAKVLLPPEYPVRDVVCVIVALAPADRPDTVNTLTAALVEVIATDPVETVGVAQV
jgi:hypothetical protein